MKEEKIKVLALLPIELPKEIELGNTLEAINMSTAASNFAADLNSEPIPFPNADTSIKKSVLFVPLNEKWLLTIPEAAAYFGVGQNRISELALQDGCKFVVFVGAKKLIKRKKFEEFLDEQYAI